MTTTVQAQAPLTPGEQGLWLLQRLAPELGVRNVAVRWEPPEPPHRWPLRETLRWLVARHPALRSCFPLRGGEPVREVRPAGEVEAELDVADVEPDELDQALRAYAGRGFDLARPALARLGLFRAGNRSCLCLVAHHLVVDDASLDQLLGEISAGYDSLSRTGAPPELPDAVAARPAPPRAESLRYWRERLAGFDPAGTRLAIGGAAPAAAAGPDRPPTFAGAEVSRRYPAAIVEAVAALRTRCRSTDAAVLLSAYLLALRGHGAGDDTVVGAMVETRPGGQAGSVGFQVSTLPLRVTIDPEGTFADLAAAVGEHLFAAVAHADVSYEMFVPELAPVAEDPRWWHHGLVRHAFNYRRPRAGRQAADGLVDHVPTGYARFELELIVERFRDSFDVRLLYSTEVHDRPLAEAVLDRVANAIRQAYSDPLCPVGDFDLRTPAELSLVRSVNDTAVDWDGPPTVPQLVTAVAAATPDAPAIVDGEHTLSYRELLAAAGAVARLLREHGVRPGELVGVTGPRSAGLAAAVLGVWSAGAAYLPLASEHPADRLRHQLDDAGCRVILDGHRLPEPVRAGRACLPMPAPEAGHELPAEPGELAYVIYTSGSTGRPKGVRITHANLANVVRHFARLLAAGEPTAMLWLTTFTFDISALELCLPLAAGGRVVVAPDDVHTAPDRLLRLVEACGVSVVQATPTSWRLMAPVAGRRLAGCDLLCGGEPLDPALARQLRGIGRRVFNVYGPTETTIWSTVAELTAGEAERVTVGRPIANTRAYVCDERGRPLVPGVPGELCLAGAGLAQGYHGRPELTAAAFRDHPVRGRYYRTGDLARLLPDGRIELLGRRDRQVKLRGHRIELAEVEGALAEHGEVRAAAVVLRGDGAAGDQLVAYLVAGDRPGLVDQVWSFARSRLPAYSLPGRILVVDGLPLTPSGKVDHAALGRSELPPQPAAQMPSPAGDPLAEQLVRVWREVLHRPALGSEANFFLNGGTSLMAVRLAEAASARCGVAVTMGLVFRAPTPSALAALLRDGGP